MCYPVCCPRCGKTTWVGCGEHAESVMRSVPPHQRCTCRTDTPGSHQWHGAPAEKD
jgi:hypothetical protein